MTQITTKPADKSMRRLRASLARSAMARTPVHHPPFAERGLHEVESIARIGSYSLDIRSGRWASSEGLDAILGIDAKFERTIEGWVSLVLQADREALVAYFTDEVLGRGRPFDKQYRIVPPDTGETRWVHGRGSLEFDRSGRPSSMLGTIADVTDHRNAQEALVASELRYAAIFEGAAEAILIAEVATRRFRWANPAACALLGFSQTELQQLTIDNIRPAQDRQMLDDPFHVWATDPNTVTRSVSCLRKDGTTLLADIKGSVAVLDGVPCHIGFFTDVTERVAADQERARLQEGLRRSERNLADAQRIAHIGSWERDLATGVLHWSAESHRMFGIEPGAFAGTRDAYLAFVHPDDRSKASPSLADLETDDPGTTDYRIIRADGAVRFLHEEAEVIRDATGTPVRYVGSTQDITERVATEKERTKLVAAVDQTSDSVIIADLAGTIEYVNSAFERVSGYSRDEAIGQNPRILKSGRHSAAFYRALWRRLSHGESWSGTLVNRRKDGSLYEEEATISPIRIPSGEITGYVAVKHDVTALRRAESGLSSEFRERAEVVAALGRIQPGESPEATAADICDELMGLAGIDLAAVINLLDPKRAVPLAVSGPDGMPLAPGRPLPAARASYLYGRATQGPWAEVWRPRPEDGAFGQAVADLGVRAIAYAPIRSGDGLLGVVAAGTRDEAYVRHLIDRLPAVGEFAATASALLSGELKRGHRDELVRARVRRALAKGGLTPVFQPIVDLASGQTIGFEALTRFADGTPPDQLIADAHAVGLGRELEVACLTAALEAAEPIPQDAWLGLNVSPDVILHSSELAALLAGRSRRIVLEVTEHAEIEDYQAVRRAVARFAPTVSLAVDDAGAGFAGLHHIVELAPRYLKADISLVHHVDRDLTRQAMIAALSHFAARADCDVIAEGIEDQAELEMLRELGVPFGQGFLLGRPAPLPPIAKRAERRRAPSSAPAAGGPRDGVGEAPVTSR